MMESWIIENIGLVLTGIVAAGGAVCGWVYWVQRELWKRKADSIKNSNDIKEIKEEDLKGIKEEQEKIHGRVTTGRDQLMDCMKRIEGKVDQLSIEAAELRGELKGAGLIGGRKDKE